MVPDILCLAISDFPGCGHNLGGKIRASLLIHSHLLALLYRIQISGSHWHLGKVITF